MKVKLFFLIIMVGLSVKAQTGAQNVCDGLTQKSMIIGDTLTGRLTKDPDQAIGNRSEMKFPEVNHFSSYKDKDGKLLASGATESLSLEGEESPDQAITYIAHFDPKSAGKCRIQNLSVKIKTKTEMVSKWSGKRSFKNETYEKKDIDAKFCRELPEHSDFRFKPVPGVTNSQQLTLLKKICEQASEYFESSTDSKDQKPAPVLPAPAAPAAGGAGPGAS